MVLGLWQSKRTNVSCQNQGAGHKYTDFWMEGALVGGHQCLEKQREGDIMLKLVGSDMRTQVCVLIDVGNERSEQVVEMLPGITPQGG